MKAIRKTSKIQASKEVMEGAGVRLKRVLGQSDVKVIDPFLLLDDFHSDDPNDYIAGFPDHPHRGIETVTYMLNGFVEHQDSIGNKGIISGGDVQWMTAGSGIIHSEMPAQTDGVLHGFQLWVNLPKKFKMMKPRYQEFLDKDIPIIEFSKGIDIKIIAGELNGTQGPVRDIVTNPEYFDITMQKEQSLELPVSKDNTVFAYIYDGEAIIENKQIAKGNVVIFDEGNIVKVDNKSRYTLKFLLISGKPIKEPIAWYGPIVMNTQDEIQTAFTEYRNGTFIKG
ncbi:MAG: pirin family protein [Candidatus Hodarchaeales archaeon]|jgi:redox-sensitive bicupin YhaK (pirin superfamily)